MTSTSEQLVMDIAQLKESIKRKHRELTRGDIDLERHVRKIYKPIIEPLTEMVKKPSPSTTDEGSADGNTANIFVKEEIQSDKHDISSADDDAYTPHKRNRSALANYYIKTAYTDDHDNVYGIYYNPESKLWKLGSRTVTFNRKSDIIIEGDKRYPKSKGLYELLFLSHPDMTVVNEKDLKNYKTILTVTGAHINKLGHVKSNTGVKYKTVIQKLFPPKTHSTKVVTAPPTTDADVSEPTSSSSLPQRYGSGMMIHDSEATVKYTYWDDPNELCERLRLLLSSKRAGHSGHDSEIASIIEELRESGIIIGGELKEL